MQAKNIFTVYRKELVDMLRDHRTLLGMVVFPLVLFPLMTVGFGQLAEKSVKKAKQETMRVILLGEEHAPELAQTLRRAEGFEFAPPARDYAQQISDKKLRAAVEFPPQFEQVVKAEGNAKPALQIYYYAAELRSEAAARRIEEIAASYRDRVVEERLSSRHLSQAILKPIETKRENVAVPEKVAGGKLAVILSYLLVILCLSGAMHPAMDLTAGEKERGTLETILASAVSRGELVVGKFLLVLTASLITAVLSLASFGLTMAFTPDYSRELTRGYAFSISLKAVASVFLLVLPLAVLFAGALVALSLFAKSYKEAQSYLGPLMLVAILPAIVAMLPGVELNPKLALVPILNVSLVAREILTGNYPWTSIGIVFASTWVYAGLALSAAVHMFQREDVLFRA